MEKYMQHNVKNSNKEGKTINQVRLSYGSGFVLRREHQETRRNKEQEMSAIIVVVAISTTMIVKGKRHSTLLSIQCR